MAAQGLIVLDVGVLMGSRSPQVMDEISPSTRVLSF